MVLVLGWQGRSAYGSSAVYFGLNVWEAHEGAY